MNDQHDPQINQSAIHKLKPSSSNLAFFDWLIQITRSGPLAFPVYKNRSCDFSHFLPEIFSLHGDGAKEFKKAMFSLVYNCVNKKEFINLFKTNISY